MSHRPNLQTAEGMREAINIIRREEFARFCELQSAFIRQIRDDTVREELEAALNRLKAAGDA